MGEEQIDATVIETTKNLFEQGYYEEEIEEKLKKMKYSDSQIESVFKEAKELIMDKDRKLKRMKFAAILISFFIFLMGIGLIAVIQSS